MFQILIEPLATTSEAKSALVCTLSPKLCNWCDTHWFSPGVHNLRPLGRMQPSIKICAVVHMQF